MPKVQDVFNWINSHKEPVPLNLIPKFDDMTECNERGFTAAMLQICKNKQMPQQELLHSPNYKDKDNYTLAHWWIFRVRTCPPKELLTKEHGPLGMTLAMFWANEISTPIPEELIKLNDLNERDNLGRTLAMYWVINIIEPCPKELYHNPYYCDKMGRVFQMYNWKFDHKDAPVEMQVAPNYKDYSGFTVQDYVEKNINWEYMI